MDIQPHCLNSLYSSSSKIRSFSIDAASGAKPALRYSGHRTKPKMENQKQKQAFCARCLHYIYQFDRYHYGHSHMLDDIMLVRQSLSGPLLSLPPSPSLEHLAKPCVSPIKTSSQPPLGTRSSASPASPRRPHLRVESWLETVYGLAVPNRKRKRHSSPLSPPSSEGNTPRTSMDYTGKQADHFPVYGIFYGYCSTEAHTSSVPSTIDHRLLPHCFF